MKNLGAILAVALIAFSFVGTSAPGNTQNPYFVDAMAKNTEITGMTHDLSEAQLMGSEEFVLPAGALGVQATYDIASGVFDVVPVFSMPDTMGESGCIIVNSFVGFGYGKSGFPPPIGDYNAGCTPNFANFYEHPGGISSESLVCVNVAYCQVFAYGQNPDIFAFQYEYMYVYCQFSTLAVVLGQTAPPVNGPSSGAITTGICQTFGFSSGGFGLYPYYSQIYESPPGTTSAVAGLVNQ